MSAPLLGSCEGSAAHVRDHVHQRGQPSTSAFCLREGSSGGFTFPFDTCEPLQRNGRRPVQPVSFVVNLASTTFLLYSCVAVASTFAVRLVLLAFAAFEAWHTASHFQHLHVHPRLQTRVIHCLGYFVYTSIFAAVLMLSGDYRMASWAVCVLVTAVAFDALCYNVIGGVYVVIGGVTVFLATFLATADKLPSEFWRAAPFLIAGATTVLALLANEARNGRRMLAFFPLPYHALVEAVGFALFVKLTRLFVDWERMTQTSRP